MAGVVNAAANRLLTRQVFTRHQTRFGKSIGQTQTRDSNGNVKITVDDLIRKIALV